MDIKNKPKILITEDDFDNQRFLTIFLGKRYDLVICDSDKTFFPTLEKHRPEVIIMDISLKGSKDGLQITRELKANRDYKDIPVICLTAHAFQKDKENAEDAGVDLFLAKPVENEILLNAIESFRIKEEI
ncbi:MAG: response regulator [Bacteroidota bacterium]|nr:response regulator [Bacteroidota bacterium]